MNVNRTSINLVGTFISLFSSDEILSHLVHCVLELASFLGIVLIG